MANGLKATEASYIDQEHNFGLIGSDIGAASAIKILRYYVKGISDITIKRTELVRSSLVGGIGIINLYKLESDKINSLSDLSLLGLKRLELVNLEGNKVHTLRQFLGDISTEHLYLLEYPDGFILSLNDELIAFRL